MLLYLYILLMFATGAVAMALVALLLSVRPGQVRSLAIMRALALLPGLLAVQTVLLTYGRAHLATQMAPQDANRLMLVVAAVVPAAGIVRMHVVGLLQLHTLPSRETLSLAQCTQIFAGSVCIALGGLVGYALSKECSSEPQVAHAGQDKCDLHFVALVSVFEGVRLALGALMLWLHKRENIAVP